ncbi:DUF5916 domain-containing protein [Temperatibacter marinus]|uniref:DUF5916 domain-containing protein n=1 Tax=Temperatibacter marinus TaxID=1456591 RepID=A0AA52EFV3_9PROT|nr:DUF5916 domain-containing protein [Temperatibacter marinus]WND01559.1 DUF5916 domain-containing protein [Temperatibacter marinus]
MSVVKSLVIFSFVYFVLSSSAFAQDKTVPAVRMQSAPTIDGLLSPGEWKNAALISKGLHQIKPRDGARPSHPTDIFIGYDNDYLYVAARMYDDNPEKIVARQMIEGTGLGGEDSFKIILSPFNNKQSGYFFKANANGVREDALFEGANRKNFNWDAIWHVRSSIDEKGWTAEFRIPFKSLNFNPDNASWGISFGRDIGRLSEYNAWTSYNRQIGVDTAGELQGVSGVKQGLGLDIVMSAASNRQKLYNTTSINPAIVGMDSDYLTQVEASDFTFEPSIDAIYKITPSLTAVLTLNTDFSATEVDDQVVNLSRFSVFLPEKRDFFLQDADLFNFGSIGRNGRPFFSRRIGLVEGEEMKIRVGGKLTGRIGQWNVGILDVLQDSYVDDGNMNLFVARVQRRIFEQSSVGAIFTYGDPITGKGAYTIGTDFLYRDNTLVDGKVFEANFWGQKTTHPDDVAGAKTEGYGTEIELGGSDGFDTGLEFVHLGEDFNPTLGYVNRTGIDQFEIYAGYKYRPNSRWLKKYEPRIWQGNWWNTTGGLQTRDTFIRPVHIEFTSDDKILFAHIKTKDVLSESFEIVDDVIIPAGSYSFSKNRYEFDSSSRRMAGVRIRVEDGDYYTGTRKNYHASARIQPNKFMKFTAGITVNKITLNEGAFTTRQLFFNSNIAFSSSLSWISRIQYNNLSREAALNSRLRYNPEPGRDFYLIVNHGLIRDQETDPDTGDVVRNRFRSTRNRIGLKVGYTLRF